MNCKTFSKQSAEDVIQFNAMMKSDSHEYSSGDKTEKESVSSINIVNQKDLKKH